MATPSSLSCNSINLICSELQSLADSILPFLPSPSPSSSSSPPSSSELFHKFALKLIQLKQLNRYILIKLDQQKLSVEQRKEHVGNSQLILENLLYKQSYLLREISLCTNDSIPNLQLIEQNLKELLSNTFTQSLTSSIPSTSLLSTSTSTSTSATTSTSSPLSQGILITNYDENLKSNHKLSLEKLHFEYQKRKSLMESIQQKEIILHSRQDFLQKKRKFIETFPSKVSELQILANNIQELFPKSYPGQQQQQQEMMMMTGNTSDETLELSRNLPTSLFLIFRSFYSTVLQSNEMNLNIVLNPESLQPFIGTWAIEVTFSRTIDDTTAAPSSQAQVTFLLCYHPRLNLVLVEVSNLSVTGLPPSKSNPNDSFPFKKSDSSRCLLPSHLRASAYFDGVLEPGLGEPEMWAQWLGGLRPLPSPGTELPFLSTASLITLVSSPFLPLIF